MKDPYSTLGVDRTASDEAVKKAYRDLARKYHPDNYVDNPLADLAQEKMKEINEAYAAIEKERANGGSAYQYEYQDTQYQSRTQNSTAGAAGPYRDARDAINTGDLDRAEMILGSIVDRGAEWNFLMGTLCYRRGWMSDASRYFRIAATQDPTNPEYRQAVSYMENAGQRPYTGSETGLTSSVDPDLCNLCTQLMVADMCCSAMSPRRMYRCC